VGDYEHMQNYNIFCHMGSILKETESVFRHSNIPCSACS
jgi:hypothetical protein